LRLVSIALTLAAGASLIACSAILGLQEPTVDESIGDGGGGDGSKTDSPTSGDGACGDTASDPLNCGACGHDCLGGACSSGQCQPVAIAQSQGGPFMVAQFGSQVYWTNFIGSTVGSANKYDGGNTLMAASGNGADSPLGIGADDAGVYFANSGSSGTVVRCGLTSCQGAATLFDAGFTNTDLAVVGGNVYWLQADGDEIDRVATGGGTHQNLATTDTNNFGRYLSRIATDGAFVYWSESFNDTILRKPIGSGSATTIYTLSSGAQPSALLLDNGTLFFATLGSDNGQGAISYGNPDGSGGAQPLAASQRFPYALASDATYLYWTAEGDFDTNNKPLGNGGVFRCAKTGCGGNPEQLASNLSDTRGIAVDDQAIYFATFATGSSDGQIWRLAK
jgi:hypothetical protein